MSKGGGGTAKAHVTIPPPSLKDLFWSDLLPYNRVLHSHTHSQASLYNTGCWGLVEEVEEKTEHYNTVEQKAA